jgi:1-deoxy-D-xylulose-5-phosphate reductoisomerase
MAVSNAANEVAVAAFLDEHIRFTDIPRVIEYTLERVAVVEPKTLSVVEAKDAHAREMAAKFIAEIQHPVSVVKQI